MLSFRIGRIQIGISIFFVSFFAILLIVSKSEYILMSMLAMLCHEIGHLSMMLLTGNSPRGLYFLLGRITIIPNRRLNSYRTDMLILCGGILVNYLLAVIYLLCGNLKAGAVNGFIALYNSLPVGNLDGGALFLAFLNRRLFPKKAYTIHLAVSFILTVLLLSAGILLILRGKGNISLMLIGVFLMIQNIKNLQYTNV